MPKDNLGSRQQKAHDDSMSLQWNSRQVDGVRPAGEGPLMQEFYAEVAQAMRNQHERALNELMFSDRVNHAQRGPQWRIWLTAFGVGCAGGALGASVIWIATNGW